MVYADTHALMTYDLVVAWVAQSFSRGGAPERDASADSQQGQQQHGSSSEWPQL